MLFAAPARADVYDRVAKRLVRGVDGLVNQKAAVLPFTYADGRESPGGRIVSEALATALVERTRAVLVERNLLDQAMGEIALSYSGAISSGTALQAGKLTGAKFLVVGSLSDESPAKVELHARLIETESGIVKAAAKGVIRRTWRDAPKEAAPPGARVVVVQVPEPSPESRIVKQFGDRRIAFQFLNTNRRPSLRLTDVTDPRRPDFEDVLLPYDDYHNLWVPGDFEGKVKLAGRRYKAWGGAWSANGPTIHVAPLEGLWGRVVNEQELVLIFHALLTGWAKELDKNTVRLETYDQDRYIGYFHRMPKGRLRVAVFKHDAWRGSLDPRTVKWLDIQGRSGREVSSPITQIVLGRFKFRYDLDTDSVKVEVFPVDSTYRP
ncbi:MAG: hypothetical protein HY554_06190 [Elusimicrobia bacterium]|nr:hypothetical protein [Elusimicrobiota bacterium]